jgi:hypothetical protein
VSRLWRTFAPYAAHVITVDLFFTLGRGADLTGDAEKGLIAQLKAMKEA